jgi:hypothetical protein
MSNSRVDYDNNSFCIRNMLYIISTFLIIFDFMCTQRRKEKRDIKQLLSVELIVSIKFATTYRTDVS